MASIYNSPNQQFFDQKGPLVLSATIHLVAALAVFLWTLIEPDKKPEELVFVLSEPPPPAGDSAAELPRLQYEPEQVEIPKIEPFKPRPVPAAQPEPLPALPPDPEPIVEKKPTPPKPKVEATPAPKAEPQPKPEPAPTMTYEEFLKQNPIKEPQNVRKTPAPTSKPIDLSKDIAQMRKSLQSLSSISLPQARIDAMTASDQDALLSYFERFKARLAQETEKHPVGARLLSATVRFDISATGVVSNARLVSSSGDAVFDRKALEAFRRLRNYQAPPSGQGYTNLALEVVQE